MSATFGQLLSAVIKKNAQTDENAGTNNEGFIQPNRLSYGYKGTQKLLKAVLFSMHGSVSPHFGC